MARSAWLRRALVLAWAGLATLVAGRAEGQALTDLLDDGSAIGAWVRVLTVTPEWIVLQNEFGQQLPVAVGDIDLFVMRWPTDPSRVTLTALLEAVGIANGANQMMTGHVDVFDGPSLQFASPVYQPVFGYGRTAIPKGVNQLWNLRDPIQKRFLQWNGIIIPPLPGEDDIPLRLRVVGPMVGANPLMIGTPVGGQPVIVEPAPSFTMTLVTPGSVSYVRPGDLAYIEPSAVGPKGLALGQLVIYKAMPFDQFVP